MWEIRGWDRVRAKSHSGQRKQHEKRNRRGNNKNVHQQENKLCFIHKMKYYTMIKKNIPITALKDIDKSHRRNVQQKKSDAKEYVS